MGSWSSKSAETPVDTPSAKLNVVIVGAGISGLSAAISLRRAGHIVDIYERSAMNNEIGAAINVPPNATRFLIPWGLDPVRWRFVKTRRVSYNNPFDLSQIAVMSNGTQPKAIGGAELYYAHRVDLHSALKWMATRPDGPGTPATIHVKSDVVACDPMAPSITLASGKIITGDVVIGADGVHSATVEAVIGHKNEPIQPEHSNCCYRFLIPADVLQEDPETRFWNEDCDGLLHVLPHNETKRRIIAYTCRDNTMHNFVAIFYDEEAKFEKKEDWQAHVDISQVLERYSDYDPRFLKVMSKATDVKRWPLLYRRPISSWSKGRMTLAGDAAHPMLPHQAQAGAQGMEDGLTLGIVLCGASTPAEIEERLAIYEEVRRGRASVIQITSNVSADQLHLVREELLQYIDEDKMPTNHGETMVYNFGFDIVKATLDAMKKYKPSFELPPDFFDSEVNGVPPRKKQ